MKTASTLFALSIAALAATTAAAWAGDGPGKKGGGTASDAAAGDASSGASTPPKSYDLWAEKAGKAENFSFDFGVPMSPALALIGTNESLAGSAALKPYTFQLPADYGGSKGAQSFAIDIAPYWFIPGFGTKSYDAYLGQHDGAIHMDEARWLRLVDRFRLGASVFLGTTGSGDPSKAKDSRAAFGASIALLDQSDPLAVESAPDTPVWATCIDKALLAAAATAAVQNDDDNVALASFSRPVYALWLRQEPLTAGSLALAVIAARHCFDAGAVCTRYAEQSDRLKAALKEDTGDLGAKLGHIAGAFDSISGAIRDKINDKAKPVANAADFDVCAKNANAYASFGSKLDLGGGVVWDGHPGALAGFAKASGAVWLSGRFPLGFPKDPANAKLLEYWLVGGSVRASWGETVATGNTTTPKFEADVVNAWLGLQSVSENFELSALGGYKWTDAVHTADSAFSSSGFRWQVSAGARLPTVLNALVGDFMPGNDAVKSGSWISVTYGSAEGTVKTLDDKELLVTLSFAPGGNLFGG